MMPEGCGVKSLFLTLQSWGHDDDDAQWYRGVWDRGGKGLLSRQQDATAFGRDDAPLGRWSGATAFARRASQVPRGSGKPDLNYLCWHLPEINGNEPDFLLYGEDVGRLPSY